MDEKSQSAVQQMNHAGESPYHWINRTVIAIIVATFFSDVSHEMATAVLPLYLASIGLGPAALGITEGVADLLFSLSKLFGGIFGHHANRKRPWASAGYLLTTVSTAAIGFTNRLGALASLRGAAWIGRGFRSPLRDFILADAVEPTHFGRAYGLERAGDMLGAVVGPLIAGVLVWQGVRFHDVIRWTLLPGLVAAAAMYFWTRERPSAVIPQMPPTSVRNVTIPREYRLFLIGVFLFGLGGFSRTFLIWLAAKALGESFHTESSTVSIAVLLYAFHNLVSAGAAYPFGRMGDRKSKLGLLSAGYVLGVGTNLVLMLRASSAGWVILAIALSGVYIAAEETLEKAAAAEMLPRDIRSLGFGYLAFANAIGDVAASLYVGLLLQRGSSSVAFGLATVFSLLGTIWISAVARRRQLRSQTVQTL
jgi:MFS family permease